MSAIGIEEQLINHLRGGEAFMPVDELLKKIPFSYLGKRPAGLPYSFYEIFSHMALTQKDILKYCHHKNYSPSTWPDDFWPRNKAPENEAVWEKVKGDYFADRKELEKLIVSSERGLSDHVPSSQHHSYFREVLLVIEHTSYHSGQLLILLRHLELHSS